MGSFACLALLCTGVHAPVASTVLQRSAGGDAVVAAEPGPRSLSIEEVGALFQRGQDRFETSDFAAAIELWTRAYEGLPDDPQLAATRALLMANIAQAHVEAHAMDGQVDHLRRADRLFEQYLQAIDPSDTQTRASVQEQRTRIAEALARHEAELEAARQQAARARDEPPAHPAPRVVPPPAAASAPQLPRRDGPRYDKWERAMVIGGGVSVAFGVGTIGALATFLWLRDEAQADGERAARDPTTTSAELRSQRRVATRFDSLAISTGAAAGVLTVLGLGLITTAEIHRAKRIRVRLGPSASFGALGLHARGRF